MTFKELRNKQNLSLRKAACKLGIKYQSICRYENKGRIPTKKILQKMIEVYGCTEEEIGQAIMKNLNIKDGGKCA